VHCLVNWQLRSSREAGVDYDQVVNKHRGLSVGLCVSLFFLNLSSVSSAAPEIVGSKCVKVGTFRTAKNVRYQCKKSTQGLRWVNVSTNRQIKATPADPSKDVVNVSTQQLIGIVNVSTSRNTTQVVMHVEAGSNGNWPNFMEGALKYSLDFYSALGFTFTQPKIDFVLGRSQPWLKSKFGELFPRCWPDDALVVGGYVLCASPDRGGILANLVAQVLPDTGLRFPDGDVSGVKRDLLWALVAHEAWHNWQQGIAYTYGVQDLPAWWIEGGANFFSTIAWAKFLDKSQSFESLWPWEFEPNQIFQNYEQQTCTTRISELSNVCSYSKGALVVQYFVYRFGVDAYRSLYSTWQKNLTFSANFQRATGMTLDQFYGLSEDWLASRGWQSK